MKNPSKQWLLSRLVLLFARPRLFVRTVFSTIRPGKGRLPRPTVLRRRLKGRRRRTGGEGLERRRRERVRLARNGLPRPEGRRTALEVARLRLRGVVGNEVLFVRVGLNVASGLKSGLKARRRLRELRMRVKGRLRGRVIGEGAVGRGSRSVRGGRGGRKTSGWRCDGVGLVRRVIEWLREGWAGTERGEGDGGIVEAGVKEGGREVGDCERGRKGKSVSI
jgi:hypothetical protein